MEKLWGLVDLDGCNMIWLIIFVLALLSASVFLSGFCIGQLKLFRKELVDNKEAEELEKINRVSGHIDTGNNLREKLDRLREKYNKQNRFEENRGCNVSYGDQIAKKSRAETFAQILRDLHSL